MIKKCLLATSISLALFGVTAQAAAPTKVLNIYNWSDYIAEDTVPNFSKANGVKVRYDVYDSNEILQAKMLTGKSGYDIVVPTNIFLAKQIQANLYQPLDKSKLPNWKGLDPELLKMMNSFDPGNKYAVPYLWGMNTLGINVDRVNKALGGKLPDNQWDLLFKPEYVSKLKSCGVSIFDSPAEVFPIVLKYLGKNPGTTNEADYRLAADLLKKIRPNITRFSSSGYINEFAGGSLCLVLGYGGDFNIATNRAKEIKSKVKLQALTPKEGVAIWIDSFVIPKDAVNVENAYKFINYNLDAKIAANNTNFVTYASGSSSARQFVQKEYLNNPSIYPSKEVMAKSFLMQPIDSKIQRLSTRLWQEIKTSK